MYTSITKSNGNIFLSDGLDGLVMSEKTLQEAVIKKNADSVWISYKHGTETKVINLSIGSIVFPVVATTEALVAELLVYAGTPLGSIILYGTPVNAVAASSVYTPNTIVTGDTVTIGAKVYTFIEIALTAPAVEGEVLLGASDEASLVNLFDAINDTNGTYGVTHSCADANTNGSATAKDATTLTFTYKTKGVVGNDLAVDASNGAWGDVTLLGGINGTVGSFNTVYQDATNVYYTPGNAISEANWKKIVKASL